MSNESKKTILLVEDEALLAMAEKQRLEKSGYAVVHVLTGEAAVTAALNVDSRPDLVLMDIDLGEGIDGTEAARQILNEIDIPVVFLSSHTEPEVVARTEKITSYGYVVKNSGITVLNTSIKMAFKLFDARMQEQQHETALVHTVDYLRSILKTTQDGFCVMDMDGRVVDVNNAYCEMCGYSRAEFLQLSIPDIDADEQPELTKERIEQIRSSGYALFDARNRRKDGSTFDVEVSASFLGGAEDKIVAFYRDITERKKFEIELQEQKDLLQNITDNLFEVVALTDRYGTIKFSGNAHRGLGYESNRLVGKTVFEFIHPEDSPRIEADFAQWIPSGAVHRIQEFRYRRSDGSYTWVETAGKKILGADGDVKELLFSSRDITERKMAEGEVQRQLAEKETLLKEVHHRIKNNMAQVEALLSLQTQSTVNPAVQAALREAMARVQSMRVLYEKLLIGEDYQDSSVKDYIESLVDSLVAVFPERENVSIEKSIADFPLSSKKLIAVGIIINELVTNIFKYAFTGRDDGHVAIRLDKSETHATLIIQDDGVGIANTVATKESAGFGLTLVQMLAEQLHGSYRIENDNGTKNVLEFEL
jgi:PAS domain S-box-containing protein